MMTPKLQDPFDLPLFSEPIDGKVKVPGSKSITNRALVLAALSQGTSQLKNFLDAEDTQIMIQCLQALGVKIEKKKDILFVEGRAGNFSLSEETLFVGNAGTVARFLCPLLTLGKGEYTLDSSERMRERPLTELVQAMTSCGCKVHFLGEKSFPLKIEATGLAGGKISLAGNVSSQFISALMLASPLAKTDTLIEITSEIISLPYIEMTRKMMESFGVSCEWHSGNQIFIPARQSYQAQDYLIEGDASAASYFFAMAAMSKGKVSISPITPHSLQGDLGFLQILKNMGCKVEWGENKEVSLIGDDLQAITVDMGNMNDVALTLGVLALFAHGVTKIENIYNLRLKECDRLSALATEMSKLGAKVEEKKDSLTIAGGGKYKGALIKTYNDHRIAMSFSLCSLKISGVKIENPLCVQKTYPHYWNDFFQLVQP